MPDVRSDALLSPEGDKRNRLNRFGEFVEPERERAFQVHLLARSTQWTRVAPAVLCVALVAFFPADVAALGWGPKVTTLAVVRAVMVAAVMFSWWWTAARGPNATGIESAPGIGVVAVGMVLIAAFRADEVVAHYASVINVQFGIVAVVPGRLWTRLTGAMVLMVGYAIVLVDMAPASGIDRPALLLSMSFCVAMSLAVAIYVGRSGRHEWVAAAADRLLVGRLQEEVAARKMLESQLQRLADYDDLTGLRNRRAFLAACEDRASRATNAHVAMVDIDFFKALNDTHGHSTGDNVLRSVAQAVSGIESDRIVTGRMGGEEFALAIFDHGSEGAVAVCETLRVRVAELVVDADGTTVTTTVSVGVCEQRDRSLLHALRGADVALYAAKARGRNRVVADVTLSDGSGFRPIISSRGATVVAPDVAGPADDPRRAGGGRSGAEFARS